MHHDDLRGSGGSPVTNGPATNEAVASKPGVPVSAPVSAAHSPGANGSASRLYAVVATYNRPKAAYAAIDALLGQTRPPDGIILVENSPVPHFAGAFADGTVEVVRPGTNTGAAGGFGIGAAIALYRGATHVTFIDDDCILRPDVLQRLEYALTARVPGAIVAPVVVAPDGETLVWDIQRPDGQPYASRAILPSYPVPARDLAFHGLTVSAEAIREAGGPRVDLFFGGPDVEFCLRLAAHGYALFYCPNAVAVHHAARYRRFWCLGSRKVPAGTPGHRYYVLRNRLLMWRIYHRDSALDGIGKVVAREVAGALLSRDRLRRLSLLARAGRDGLLGNPRRTMPNAVPLHR